MFKFSNIKKLFSYNWSTTIRNAVPKGNNSMIQDGAFKDIMNGAIVRILAVIFSKVAAIGIAIYTVVKAYSWLYGSEIMSYAISVAVTDSLGEWVLEIISASIIPIIILIYINIMKKKNQNSWPYFILLIISLIQTFYSLYGCIGWFTSFLINPIFAILGLVSVFLTLLGNVHISVGCIDYCLKSTSEYQVNNFNNKPYQPNQNYQPNPNEQVINSQNTDNLNSFNQNGVNINSQVQNNQIPQQQSKFCNQCGAKLPAITAFCPNCGNKI